jgi:hypothetical protein
MAGLASLDPSGSIEPASRNCDTNGHRHEVVKEAVMDSRFSAPACVVLWCGVIALGATAAEAAGIGVHLRFMRKTFRGRLQGGHNPHVGVGERARRRRRDCIRTQEVFSSIQRAKVRRSNRANERSM